MQNYGTFAAAGDLFITRRLPENGYTGFEKIQAFMQAHDVRFGNLEVTVHNREGYPSAFSGGTWAMTAPGALDDLIRFGFNVFNAATNHSMDYSHGGLKATISYLEEREMPYAGIGENLADASAPVYVEGPNIRASLVAATSSFYDSDAAGSQRMDLPGRPGLNPLRFKTYYHVKKEQFEMLSSLAGEIDINAQYNLDVKEGFAVRTEGSLRFGQNEFVESHENRKETTPSPGDLARITASIREARRQSDFIMVSIHSHEMTGEDKERPAEFLRIFAHACIDAGASVILGHGPHILRGIEVYNKGLIFYSLGNFIFQNDTTTHQPADFFEKYELPDRSLPGEGMDKRSHDGAIGLGVNPDVWRSVVAEWEVTDGVIHNVRLHPITLRQDLPRYRRGLPEFVEDTDTLEHLRKLSEEFRTVIRIEGNVGIVEI